MFKFTQVLLRQQTNLNILSKHKILKYSSTISAEPKVDIETKKTKVIKNQNPSNNIVAAAFASLSKESLESNSQIETPITNQVVENAKTIEELFSASSGEGVSRKHALKVVSVLADWSLKGTIKLADFESDPRFIRLCRILTKVNHYNKVSKISEQSHNDDLSTIMTVAADDEAAKLVASFNLAQMVKVMQTLATKQRRSTLLLRSLSFNITKSPQRLNLKQSSDLLYSMCVLSFPDENLLEKITNDILQGFEISPKKSSVIGSIVTSLGLLRYKDSSGLLDLLCAWITENFETCRSQDVFSLVHTLGVLNYDPANESSEKLFKTIAPQLAPQDTAKANVWLDFVWSLVVLNKARDQSLSTILNDEFIAKTKGVASHLKILQCNAAAQHLIGSSYKGQLLPRDCPLFETNISRTKEKADMVNSVLDTLKNLMKSDTCVRSNVNTKMGFLIDAECVLDKKNNPVSLEKYSAEAGHIKVAIMAQEYHDMSRGKVESLGMSVIQERLLQSTGYRVILIPYHDYRARDKLIHRVQFIESKLKSILH